jgi:BirA family biotin operon repressor/biotin-[acetyl-CoA-carboxylase] ligase
MKPSATNLLSAYHLLSYDEIDSTNEEAKRLARGGGAHGAVIWAKQQTAGRGRYGRKWESAEGNLFVSILLSPDCDIQKMTQLSYVAGLAAHEAIAPLLPDGQGVFCKWPNDILVEDQKLAGILLESFQHDATQWVVLGFGVNVDSFPKDVMFPATSLTAQGVEIISAKIVLSRFIHHFIANYDLWEKKGFAPIRRNWLKCAWRLGQPIRACLPNEEVEGVFKDIDADGGLVLMTKDKKKRTIHTADVFASTTQLENA